MDNEETDSESGMIALPTITALAPTTHRLTLQEN